MLKLSDSDSEKNIDYLPLSSAVESKTLKRRTSCRYDSIPCRYDSTNKLVNIDPVTVNIDRVPVNIDQVPVNIDQLIGRIVSTA